MDNVIKRKILLEDSVDRTINSPTWGVMTATTFYIKINLTQNIDDMGMLTDIEYIPKDNATTSQPDYTLLVDKLSASGITFPFMDGAVSPKMTGITKTNKATLRMPDKIVSNYYVYGNTPVTGLTESRIDELKSYDSLNEYKVGLDMYTDTYNNYKNILLNGVSRVHSIDEPRIYVFDTINDTNIGTDNQVYGIKFLEYTGKTRDVVIDNLQSTINLTSFRYISEGWNETNTSLSATTKEDYLFGITTPPQVQSDVYIDRGQTSVLDMHFRLSEIKNLGELTRYGNGFYKLKTQ
jgi:hypothetical protein